MTVRNTLLCAPSSRSNNGLFTQLTLAGTAALAGSVANAQVTVVPINETVGFNADVTSFISSLPGTSQFTLALHTTATSNGIAGGIQLKKAAGNWALAVNSGSYLNFAAGRKFSTIAATGNVKSNAQFVSFAHNGTSAQSAGYNGISPSYVSFQFTDTANSNQIDYGWIELGLVSFGSNHAYVSVIEYAYDLSGNQLAGGQTTSVPEPSQAVALAAFGALILGAAGVRRLKALRN